jgi:hypothetical protein
MIPSNTKCEQAAQHYFDVLGGNISQSVPEEMAAHIQQCDRCKAEIEQLKTALCSEKPDDQIQNQIDTALAVSLELQYAYAGLRVMCGQAKPFLPSLADPVFEIRVPTPITAHLDNCKQCADDLETIRRLNLTHTQLCRLGQLFAEKPAANQLLCAEAKKAMPFMARLDFEGLPADMLKHVCLCTGCRRALLEQRDTAIERIGKQVKQQQLPCGTILPKDIFDYAIPYGVDPQDDEYCRSRKSLISHTALCSDCFERIQNLQKTIFEIVDRPASGIATKFLVSHSVKDNKLASSAYGDPAIRVEVTHKAAALHRIKERLSAANLKLLIKPAAAAAVILFALLFYFNTPAVNAVDLAQVYAALTKITNVHIASFVPAKAEPTQQQWISKTLNISIFKTPTELVLWDIPNSTKRIKNIDSGTIETTSISSDSMARVQKNIEGTLNLLPFNSLSELPADAKWKQITEGSIESLAPDTNLYDLTWTQKGLTDSVILKRWRVFVDSKTGLPQRVEWYEKVKGDDDYVLKSYMLVDYLSQPQIQTIIRDFGF